MVIPQMNAAYAPALRCDSNAQQYALRERHNAKGLAAHKYTERSLTRYATRANSRSHRSGRILSWNQGGETQNQKAIY